MKRTNIWLVGAGKMAQDYAAVMSAMQYDYTVVGRGCAACKRFQTNGKIEVISGGVQELLLSRHAPQTAVVAVGVEQIADVVNSLIVAGTKDILVEKPAGLTYTQNLDLLESAEKNNVNLLVAYNRRFLSSVIEAERMIEEDGGVLSAHFEFTEWSHVILGLSHSDAIKHRWLIANSSHVIDLAFYLCGRPRKWSQYQSGSLNWHPAGARFMGAGVTNRDVMFSYFADWEGPGRWGLELITAKRRLILKPVEKLAVIQLGSVEKKDIAIQDALDTKYKPGLYRQTKAFLDGDYKKFCLIKDQFENIKYYSMIAGYEYGL